MTERLHPNCKDGIVVYRHYWNLWLYHCYKFNNINTLPSCSSSFHCQNSLGTYRVIKNNLKYLLCVSYGIIEGLTRISRILSRTFGSLPCSRLPSGRDRWDRLCDTPLLCCPDSPLSASPGLWYRIPGGFNLFSYLCSSFQERGLKLNFSVSLFL